MEANITSSTSENGASLIDSPIAEEARKKLDRELGSDKAPYAKIIIEYLKKRVGESESLAQDVMQEHKTWKRCWKYIYSKASKEPRKGNCAAIEDKVVFEWAEDFYRCDDKALAEAEKAEVQAKEKKAKAVKPTKKAPAKKETTAKAKKAKEPEVEAVEDAPAPSEENE